MAEVLRSLHLGGDPAKACARALGADGVVLSAIVGNARMSEPLWCHPAVSAQFEELQFTLGEGPGPDAVRTGAPVLVPDLDRVRHDRWPALLAAAREMGIHGVCCFPLGLGAVRVGVLTVLCAADRTMSAQQMEDARVLAAALTSGFLNGDGPGSWSPDQDGLGPLLQRSSGLNRPAVHQATGMISVQLGVTMDEALLRLRAHAYGAERPLGEVAADVVARLLRFDNDKGGPYSPEPDGGEG